MLDLARWLGQFFSALLCKILKTFELLDPVAEQSSQNLEPLGLTGKIFFSKNLAGGAKCCALCLYTLPSSEIEAVEGKGRCHMVVLWKSVGERKMAFFLLRFHLSD
jgi:hypothetical protein